ncbi:MAG: hypothetical protein ACJ712_08660 [Nitrososphaeraceae archaeon]|jgi:hypothetical protein
MVTIEEGDDLGKILQLLIETLIREHKLDPSTANSIINEGKRIKQQ